MAKYINENNGKIICPWCKKEVTQSQIENEETFVNGGEQTGDMIELWHDDCAEDAEEYERDNGLRM